MKPARTTCIPTPADIGLRIPAHLIADRFCSGFHHALSGGQINKVEQLRLSFREGFRAGKLYMKHKWAGSDLLMKYAVETLKHIHNIWGKEVILETVINKQEVAMICNSGIEDPKLHERGPVPSDKKPEPSSLSLNMMDTTDKHLYFV